MDKKYWGGLIDWMHETLVQNKTISKSDIEIFNLVDTPEEAVKIVKRTVIV